MYSLKDAANRTGARLIAIFGMALGLAACGGGGDSAPASGGVTLPTAPVTITSTNQAEVAGAAVDAAVGAGDVSAMAVQTSATKSPVGMAERVSQIGSSVLQQIETQKSAQGTVTGIVLTYNCPISGTYAFDIPTLTSITTTFTDCSDVVGETINGTIVSNNVNTTTTSLTADTIFDLSFKWPNGSGTAKGDMHFDRSGCTTDPVTYVKTCNTNTISGTSLTFTDSVLGNDGLQNYSITTDIFGNVTAMTFTFASTVINGTATFTLVTPFTYNLGLFPNSGSATITGVGSNKLRITVLGDEFAPVGSQVQLELSTDNGTTYGTPVYVTWASISRNL